MTICPPTFTITEREAVYIVASLYSSLATLDLNENDLAIIAGILDRLVPPMELPENMAALLTGPRRRQ